MLTKPLGIIVILTLVLAGGYSLIRGDIFAALINTAEAATLIYQNDFESGLGKVGFQYKCRDEQFKVVSNRVRNGSKALQIFQSGTRTNTCKSGNETRRHRSFLIPGGGDVRFNQETNYWIGFSVYLPSNFPINEAGFSFLNVKYGGRHGETYIYVRKGSWDFQAHSNQGAGPRIQRRLAKVPLKPSIGRWTDMVFEIRRSIKGTGVIRAWMDGKKVAEYKGDVGTDYEQQEKKSPVPKLGIYWSYEKKSDHTLYLDAVKIATGPNGYSLVAPSGSPPEGGGGSSTSSGGGTVTSGFCHKITGTFNMPDTPHYAPPYNVLTTKQELLISVFCDADGETKISMGNGSNLQYIYQYGYHYRNNIWNRITLKGDNKTANAWYPGVASVQFGNLNLSNENYFLAYICSWTGSVWKCGCRDATCATNHWNLQVFRR